MTLSALIKKGGLADRMAATVATVATQETDQPVTVATVAVAKQPELRPELSLEMAGFVAIDVDAVFHPSAASDD